MMFCIAGNKSFFFFFPFPQLCNQVFIFVVFVFYHGGSSPLKRSLMFY